MENNAASSTMTMTVEDRDLIMERTFDAPRDLVFQAYTETEHLKRWWGPTGWTTPVCNLDFRVGGVWHFCMESPDGEMKSWGRGDYHEIIVPEKIVYTDSFSDEEGNVVKEMPEMLVTLTFHEHEGKTTVISRTQFPTVESLKSLVEMGLVEGFTETWDSLDAHLKAVRHM